MEYTLPFAKAPAWYSRKPDQGEAREAHTRWGRQREREMGEESVNPRPPVFRGGDVFDRRLSF